MVFARRLFFIAGILGVLAVLPMYLLRDRIGHDQPPSITHPEYYYGFIGVCLAWQVGFLVIARDPARFRPLMIPAVLEKATYSGAIVALAATEGLPPLVLGSGLVNLTLGVLFVVAYWKTGPSRA